MSANRLSQLSAQLVLFMDEHIYPNEKRYTQEIAADRHRPSPLVEELKPKAKEAGLWNLFWNCENTRSLGRPSQKQG